MDEMEQSAETLNSDAAAAAAEEHDQQAEQHDAQADEVSQEETEEEEEIEIGGKKLAMPKSIAAEIKAGTMRNADYTQKTQAVAEERRAVEAERARVREEAQQQQQFIKEVARVHALESQLTEFRALTPEQWDAISDQDPVQAQKLQIRYQALQQQYNEAAQAVTQKQNEHALAEQQSLAKQVQEAEAYVQREIPGWTQERATALNSYATAEGVKIDQAVARVLVQNPALMKIFDKAEKFDQLVKKQATKPQGPAAPPPPATRVGATRAAAKPDPAKMTDAQWYASRKELGRKR